MTNFVHEGEAPHGDGHESGGASFHAPEQGGGIGVLAGSDLLRGEDPRSGMVTKSRRQPRWIRVLGYLGLGLLSFLVFLYLTFPFAVIKEGLVAVVSDTLQRGAGLDLRVNIGSLRPHWLTGVALENVTLTSTRDSAVQTRFGVIRARLNVLPLFIGRVSVSALVSQSAGSMEADVSMPISGLLTGNLSFKSGEVEFRSFPIDSFIQHAVTLAKSSDNPAMAFVSTTLAVTTGGGFLNGRILFSGAPPGATAGSTENGLKGQVDLNFRSLYLHVADNILQIPRQEFSEARLDAKLDPAGLSLSNATSFQAPDLGINVSGRINFGKGPGATDLNLALKLAMRRQVQKNFGFLATFLKCMQPLKERDIGEGQKEAILDAKLSGPTYAMQCEQVP